VLDRATRTLESGQSWNAFATAARADAQPAITAGPVYDAEPVYSPGPVQQQPVAPAYGLDAPVAGRVPASLPQLPAAGPSAWHQQQAAETPQPIWNAAPAIPAETPQPAWNAAPAIPHQRSGETGEEAPPLRRRVPGSQLPAEAAMPMPAAAPTPDDAVAARAAFDAFEAGVSRAQWDAAESTMASPPSAGHAPLARRVPGATLPRDEPHNSRPPAPATPLDPEAARAQIEQFEYGVALALNETQPQHEGQPR
jgi:hypothetical protein